MRNVVIAIVVLMLGACTETPDRGPEVVRGVNYIGMSVSNLERSAKLYQSAVNLQQVENQRMVGNAVFDALSGRSGTKMSTRLMRSSNAQLQLMEFESRSPAAIASESVDVNGPGIAHVCFQVAKKTRAYDHFLEGGATHIGDRDMVQLSSRNPVSYAYARDLDGTIVEIEHVNVEALDLDIPPKNDYRIRHVSLATPDIDRAVAFYSELLNEKNPRRLGRWFKLSGEKLDKVSGLKNSKIEMAWFQIRNIELEIIQYASHPTMLAQSPRPLEAYGYNMIVFDVADLAAAREKLIAAGGFVESERSSMDGGEIMFGRDPDGNLLGFQIISDNAAVSSQNFTDNGI